MSAERDFRANLQAMSEEAFKATYLGIKEAGWAEMTRGQLHHWMAEVHHRGLATELEDAVGEIRLAPTRHLVMRQVELSDDEVAIPSPSTTTTSMSADEATSRAAFPQQWAALDARHTEKKDGGPAERPTSKSEDTTTTGDSSTGPDHALVVGPGQVTALPSTEASSGALNGAESGYEIVAYRRLPLAGRRDAFIAEGFLYVRNKTLKQWFEHLCLGKCCPAQRDGMAYHSTGCWLDAVR